MAMRQRGYWDRGASETERDRDALYRRPRKPLKMKAGKPREDLLGRHSGGCGRALGDKGGARENHDAPERL